MKYLAEKAEASRLQHAEEMKIRQTELETRREAESSSNMMNNVMQKFAATQHQMQQQMQAQQQQMMNQMQMQQQQMQQKNTFF